MQTRLKLRMFSLERAYTRSQVFSFSQEIGICVVGWVGGVGGGVVEANLSCQPKLKLYFLDDSYLISSVNMQTRIKLKVFSLV